MARCGPYRHYVLERKYTPAPSQNCSCKLNLFLARIVVTKRHHLFSLAFGLVDLGLAIAEVHASPQQLCIGTAAMIGCGIVCGAGYALTRGLGRAAS